MTTAPSGAFVPGAGDYEGVVVLGSPRSGTTLLRRLFNAHPAFHCPPETYLLSAAARFLHSDRFASGLSVGVLPALAYSGVPEHRIVDGLRTFVFGLLRDLADDAGKPRWVEKTAFDSFHVDGIEKLCGGRCRYVIVVRHGLDVACSIRELTERMGTYVPELHEYVRRHPTPVEAFAHAWVDVSRRLLRLEADHPDLCVRVRYEDLVADPRATLDRVFGFLGERGLEDLSKALERTGDGGLGDWKAFQQRGVFDSSVRRWEREFQELPPSLAAALNPVLTELGYDALETSAHDEAVARRRLQLELMLARLKTSESKAVSS